MVINKTQICKKRFTFLTIAGIVIKSSKCPTTVKEREVILA
jgi:hypothetical protein